MQCRGKVFPALCSVSCVSRPASTAAKLKPRVWSVSIESSSNNLAAGVGVNSSAFAQAGSGHVSSPRLDAKSKWHPRRKPAPLSDTASTLPKASNLSSLSQAPSSDALSKWARPRQMAQPQKRNDEKSRRNVTAPRQETAQPKQGVKQDEGPGASLQSTDAIPIDVVFGIEADDVDPIDSRRTRNERRRRETKWKKRIFSEDQMESVGTRMDKDKLRKKKTLLPEKRVPVDVYIPTTVSLGTLARLLGVRLEHLQQTMRQAGMSEEAQYDHVLTSDYAILLAEEFGRNPIVSDEASFDLYTPPPHPNPSSLPARPPVVTIMGHVDHGKTTLLDKLRSSSVAKGEAGGITQHIGAFSVPVSTSGDSPDGPRSITFLDTPGHAAFSAMRARGASVTDIIVLVVAADDGVMPQTREVIELIKKDDSKLGLVVAITKVDKPGVDIDAVYKALMAENIHVEAFGGDIPSVQVSGLTGQGLPDLLETISAIAEVQDLRAESEGSVHGYVIESKVHKGLGSVATVLVLRGSLATGSHIISGVSHGKVRLMHDCSGAPIKAAYPGMAVTVSGWKSLPNAGDEVLQGSEAEIKKAVANRIRRADIASSLVDVEAINASRRQEREQRELDAQSDSRPKEVINSNEGVKELRLIVKADVSGSAEAVVGALQGIGNQNAMTKVVSSGVGEITESDVMMAKAIGGMIVGFSVPTPRVIESLAARNGVPISSSNIIYQLMDDIKERVIKLLPVITETRVIGEATVLQLFDIQLKAKQNKKIAGCRVVNGALEKGKFARVIRNGETIHDGTVDTMRHLKKDVMEVRKGFECGLSFTSFNDFLAGDLIQMYENIERPGVL